MTIRWGIVGCGDVCEVKSGPAFDKVEGSALTYVMRRDLARAQDFARRHRVPRASDRADDVIGSPEVDVVYVATPPGSHHDYALRVAAAGKPCYVEKPMARNAAECRAMVAAFERAGQPLFVAYYRRAQPRFRRVRELIEQGRLGDLMSIHHDYRAPLSRTPTLADSGWRELPAEAGGGLFLDLGSHALDIMDFLVGPIREVRGGASRRVTGRGHGVEDTVVASFAFDDGVLGTASYAFHGGTYLDRLEIVGTAATLRLGVFGTDPLLLDANGAIEEIEVGHPRHVQQPLIETIVRELEGAPVRCPSRGDSAARTSEVMDRILETYYGGRDDAFWERDAWRR